jgi:hypothetical protein
MKSTVEEIRQRFDADVERFSNLETGLVTLRQLLLHANNHLRHHLRFLAEKRAPMTTP